MSGTPWERILQYHKTTSRPIEVCVGPFADAAAACRTLTELLSGFLVPASHHPIHSYETLKSIAATQRSNDDGSMHLYVLIGLGAAFDLRQCFQFATDIVVVLDSFRPVHLNNLRFDSANLILWGADSIKASVSATFAALRRRRKRRRSSEPDDGESSSGDDDERSSNSDEDEDADNEDWMDTEKANPELEKLYYAAEHCSRSSAVEVRNLAVSISRVKDQYTWNAAVGVTDMFLRRSLDLAAFTVEMGRLRDAVVLQNATRRTNLSDVTNAGARRSTHEVKLQAIDDDQLFLLRHWTLWNAIWHDTHAASLLGLHHVDDGIEKLRLVLATCGISIKLAEQGWMEVPQEDRRRAMGLLRKELKELAGRSAAHHKYQAMLPAISRSVGFATEVSSFDAVRLFNAVLAHSAVVEMNDHGAVDANTSNEQQAAAAQVASIRQYWKAHAVLQCDSNNPAFALALQECKTSARTIATATSALMQRGNILTTRAVHYSLLTDANRRAVALESFYTPARLRMLGDHLLVALAAERDPRRLHLKPLLLACAIPNSDEFLVVCSHAGPSTSSVVDHARPKPLPLIQDFADAMVALGGLQRPSIDRLCVVLPSREQASHFCEEIHLRSVTKSVH